MLEWIAHRLRARRVTTHYPRRPEHPPEGYQGPIELLDAADAPSDLSQICPTGAIAVDSHSQLSLDRGRCILCGACVRAAPDRFAFARRYETAAHARGALILDGTRDEQRIEPAWALADRARALRRSIHVRHIDTGSDGAEEWEIQALWNPYYDIQRLGFFLTASPRHADILLVTGAVTTALREPLQRTWEVMPEPKALIAAGTDACSGGLCSATGTTAGGVDAVLGVDVYVPGSPPSPIALLDGLLLAVGLLRAQAST
ncbi:MAG: ferredoxin [Solirubrobacteraceae bacterium]